ncbi:MAG TPA: carboxypeptidase-like regulatory domain-containing protein [Thermoanaerobaculia bacterium]|jgi:hypothetical protein|nr:carboxypeptidase-like regulatory domain-containing protein [Thermoanaerobaculia bacterium]
MSACRCLGLALLVLPLSAASAEPIRVTGRVIAIEEQSGKAGALVELLPAYEDDITALRRLREGEPAPLASARTRADGSFEITAPESGGFRVSVRAEGYLPVEVPFLLLIGETELPPTPLVPGKPLEVRTVGTAGQPLAGIEVRLTDSQARWQGLREEDPSDWRMAERSAVSGSDGRLTLPVFGMEPSTLTAVSPAFLGQSTSSAPGSPATLRLSSREAVTIELQDKEGKPVPNGLIRWRGEAVFATGPDGRLSIAIPSGEPPLVTGPQGWAARIVRPEGSGAGTVAVRLQPPRRIAGRVVDLASGRPVAGALVWSGWPLLAPVARTDGQGAFQLEVPAGEDSWLQAAAAGFLGGDRQPAQPGGSANVLKLTPAAALSGVVVDSAGRPVAGVKLMASPSNAFMRRPDWAAGQSRNDGGFRLTGLRPGEVYELRASREGFTVTKLTARTAPAGGVSAPLCIVMKEGGIAFGRVVDEAGQPIAGAEVRLTDTAGGAEPKARSDQGGRFEFHHVGAAVYDLLARARGYSFAQRSGIEIPAEETPFDLGAVTLPAGAVVEGKVTDTRGTAIEGATIGVDPSQFSATGAELMENDQLWDIQTGADGKFRLEGLRRGERYDLSVSHAGYVMATAPGVQAPTAEPIRIEMKAARSIAGRVVGPTGEPVAGASLSRIEELRFGGTSSASSSSVGTTDSEGLFRVPGLPAGTVNLAVSAEGYEARKVEGLQIPEGRDLEGVEIRLQRGAILEVQVFDASGEPVRDVSVDVDSEKPPDFESFQIWRPSFGQTDSRGRCLLSVKGGETYRVTASRNLQSATARVTAGPGTTPVELRLPPGVEVSGRVIGSDGETAREASVHLEGQDQLDFSVPVTADGSFVFSGVPDGDFSLQAQARSGKVSHPLEVTIAGRPLRNLELRLDREDERPTLSGRILGLSPEKLEGVFVTAVPAEGGSMLQGTVGPEGEYRIEKVEPGVWHVQAQTEDSRQASASVEIEPGVRNATQDLEFPSGALTLSGRVLLDGAPLVGAVVGVAMQGGKISGGLVATAWDGSFSLGDLAPGAAILVIFNMSGIGASRTLELTESQEMVIELVSGRLRGTLIGASGEPVADGVVTIEGLIGSATERFPAGTFRSGPDGAFQSPRLVAGMYNLTIEKEGFAPTKLTVEVPGGNETNLEIPLRLLSPP